MVPCSLSGPCPHSVCEYTSGIMVKFLEQQICLESLSGHIISPVPEFPLAVNHIMSQGHTINCNGYVTDALNHCLPPPSYSTVPLIGLPSIKYMCGGKGAATRATSEAGKFGQVMGCRRPLLPQSWLRLPKLGVGRNGPRARKRPSPEPRSPRRSRMEFMTPVAAYFFPRLPLRTLVKASV
ncbi:hypothetical protein EJ06DRAFT_404862 [Trichodelitschia bisporula]|uniref:Uncharacterized protein n=1 Tax=Trichodelitschia bisporula TaxID=703511 RepID=A0A6G1HXH9_9PEZI|nr:hypothetical protein EJ06DRAFT_404862 [Trichodelitschia bisporula]